MKTKITLSLFAILITTFLGAQNVPNGGFENWTDNEPDDWNTTNLPGSDVITQSSDAFSGSSSIRGQSIEVNNDNLPVEIEAEGPPEGFGVGFPISEQFTKMTFRYKFDNGNNDELIAVVSIRNTDSVSIGLGSIVIDENSEGWSIGTVLIDYTGEGTAAFAAIQIIMQDGTGGEPPSTDAFFIIDDVEFSSGPTGIIEESEGTLINVYPNPASNVLNIDASNDVRQVTLINPVGQEVYNALLETDQTSIDLSGYSVGVYMVQFKSSDGTILSTQKVIINN